MSAPQIPKMEVLSPFRHAEEPPKRNWLARLLRIGRSEDMQAQVERLFAATDPTEVSVDTISDVIARARLSGSGVRAVLSTVWAKALTSFLIDEVLSEQEAAYLARLRTVLGISQNEVNVLEREIVHPRYQKALSTVLADGHISEAERRGLQRLAMDLRLSPEVQAMLYAPEAQEVLDRALTQSMADERFSAQEEAAFNALASHLGIQPTLDNRTRDKLARMALFWRIENGQFPIVSVPIALQRSETCHFTSRASWHELRTRTVRVNYSGVSTSIRICKGVRFRVGSITPQRVTREELTHIDDGTLYITNKRLIFDGSKKNSTIRHTALIGLQIYSDGIVLEKATGKSPHLILNGDVELAAVILSALLSQS